MATFGFRLIALGLVLGLAVAAQPTGLVVPAGAELSATPEVTEDADFNGDGYADLLMAVLEPHSDNRLGGVYISYGSVDGLQTSRIQFVDKADLPGMGESTSQLDSAMVAADFNGDGYSDLALSTPRLKVAGQTGAGAVHVLHGSASGLSTADAQVWSQASGGVAGVPETRDLFGAGLVAGDVGGGPEADLVIGVPREDVGTAPNAGLVHVLHGSPAGLTASGSLAWTQGSRGVPGRNEAGDRFGSTLAIGDFDGRDGADLAIGAPDEAVGARHNAGAVVILYNSSTGLAAAGSQLWTQDTSGIGGAAEAEDRFGSALATGNISSRDHDDLVVAAVGERYQRSPGLLGRVYVIDGSSRGLTTAPFVRSLTPHVLPNPDQLAFGQALAVADLGGDCEQGGCEDLAIGAPEDPNCCGLGLVYVFNLGSDQNQILWLTPGRGPNTGSFGSLGFDLAAANFGYSANDGFADLAIGAPTFPHAEAPWKEPGSVHVLPGGDSGLMPSLRHTISEETLGISDVEGTALGFDLSAGGAP